MPKKKNKSANSLQKKHFSLRRLMFCSLSRACVCVCVCLSLYLSIIYILTKRIYKHFKNFEIFLRLFFSWHFHWNWPLSILFLYYIDDFLFYCRFSSIVLFLVMILLYAYIYFSTAKRFSVCLSLVLLCVIVRYSVFVLVVFLMCE